MPERKPLLRLDIEANVMKQEFTIHHEVGPEGSNGDIWRLVDLMRKVADTIEDITGRTEVLRRQRDLREHLDASPITRGMRI